METLMERRPLAIRETMFANSCAKFLAKRQISPNAISILSVVFSVLAFFCFYFVSINHYLLLLAAFFIQMRLLCNLFDGMVAIEYNKKSVYGNLFNDVPDRIADLIIIIGLGICSKSIEYNSYAMTFAWLNASLAIMTAYLRVLGTSLGAPTNFSGIMAKPQRMALVTFAAILKFFWRWHPSFLFIALVVMSSGLVMTIFTRIRIIAMDLKMRGMND
jgi:phosphatidylglycerophosphate synthase